MTVRERWLSEGYVVLPGAAASEALDALQRGISEGFAAGDDQLLWEDAAGVLHAATPDAGSRAAALVDLHAPLPVARDLLLGVPVAAVVSEALEATPLLFRSRLATVGAPAFGPDIRWIAVTDPGSLAGARVALEDGHVTVLAGSHTLEPYRFSGRSLHFNLERDGQEQLAAADRDLDVAAAQAGLERRAVTLSRGDVLIWAGGLAHGEEHGRALVGHFCGLGRAEPGWTTFRDDRSATVPHGPGAYASEHHDLGGAPDAEQMPSGVAALPGTPAIPGADAPMSPHVLSPAARRRAGGLVGKMRGRLGRP